ncbi:MAG: phosphoribosylanthranilate isomerase [Phycisphaerales bacterium]|nr:phosphoribosylanthranilate isomerase [Phycisphaerales bacterium]
MLRTRVKICGLVEERDVIAAVDHGADAVGFVFSRSIRRISLWDAGALLEVVPPLTSTVAVFAEPDPEFLEGSKERQYRFSHWQTDVENWDLMMRTDHAPMLIPVFRLGRPDAPSLDLLPADFATPLVEGPRSGAGQTCDWTAAAALARQRRIILAGGLTPDNVADAIRTVRPHGVDVSSGVESSPGKKDPIKIRDFLQAVRDVDRELQ